MAENFAQILVLLSVSVSVIVLFQRLHIPTSLGYLLVGIILSPHTIGPALDVPEIKGLAEFGVVFLLFTIGLNYSLPQLHALRGQVLGLGTAQVALGTAVVMGLAMLAGMPTAAAFVIGAVFAQSSSTIIGSQLTEQAEQNTPYGRLGLAVSVFQDVTAVPFLVIIPVLGMAVSADALAGILGLAMAKAALAFALVFFVGKWLFRPLFHIVTKQQSLEALTLAVLLVVLLAAWSTNQLGLSLAFGAFLAGMMLGETEFRHQVESSIRPFRDVLLGLFFIGVGMLLNPSTLPDIWLYSLLGMVVLLLSKIVIVLSVVRRSGVDWESSLRTALIVSVGGEFGLALLALALGAQVLDIRLGQIILTSVLFSMVAGAMLIRFNGPIARFFTSRSKAVKGDAAAIDMPAQTVLIGGYGRVGHTLAVLFQTSGIPYVAFDSDPKRVEQGRVDGHHVFYGDVSDPELLAAIQPDKVALVILTTYESDMGLRATGLLHKRCPHVPIIARAEDLQMSAQLMAAGATHAYPEAIESSLRLAATAMTMLNMPSAEVDSIMQGIRDWDYQPVVEDVAK
jgi:CPA2 family monovalent cation:H+ antiporter-2